MRETNKRIFLMLCLMSIGAANGFDYSVSAPQEITAGRWFDVNVSVFSEEPANFSVYSYVYLGNTSVGQGWIANRQNISLSAGEHKEITLSDLVKYNTEEGYYKLRVRFWFSPENNITETYNVKVFSEKSFGEIYLYLGLVVLCTLGVLFAFKFNR